MMRTLRAVFSVAGVALLLLVISAACDGKRADEKEDQPGIAEPPAEGAPSGKHRLRTVYVPAYSHLPQNVGPPRSLLSILLSVRNVDSSAVIVLRHVDYFDTSGHRVRRYLNSPKKLRPLETAEFMVDTEDETGGSGANFLVYWEGPSDAHPLLTESVMWGYISGRGYLSFTSRGVELERRPDPQAFLADEPASPPLRLGGDAAPENR